MKTGIVVGVLLLVTPVCLSQSIPTSSKKPTIQTFQPKNTGAYPVEKLRPVALPDGRFLVGVGDSVYMLDSDGKQLWKYETGGATLTSEPVYNAALSEVAVTGYDLLFVRLDATTGKVKWKADSNGRATFASVLPYGKGYLVIVDMSGYREQDTGEHLKTLDALDFWGESDKDFWSIDFPIKAELLVAGENIYAVIHVQKQVRLIRLYPPPIRKSQKSSR